LRTSLSFGVEFETASASEILAWALESYGDEFAIATSFQKEGMAILDIAARISPRVRVFTLDTGRLPNETYRMIETVRERYGIATEIVQPDPEEVRHLVALRGRDSFYESVDARRACCDVRKVRPLERKLATLGAWATGVRREQSELRAEIPKLALSATPVKLNPLADWTAAQVDEYTRANRVPVHPLYASGYASIGCAPCTRAILPGEDARAGRWWWEHGAHKECGIHFHPDGKLRRAS
jgi:thioredoxin-dependent adenylylsulfate APS reductase